MQNLIKQNKMILIEIMLAKGPNQKGKKLGAETSGRAAGVSAINFAISRFDASRSSQDVWVLGKSGQKVSF